MPMILLWTLLCCIAAGLAGAALKLPTIWGESLSVWTYAVPWPMGWGLLHWPSLLLGGFVILWARRHGRGGRRLVVATALGLLLAAGLSTWDPQFKRWQMHPWTLFWLVDGAVLLVLSPFTRGPAHAPAVARWMGAAAMAASVVPVVLLLWAWDQQYRGARVASTSIDPARPGIQRVSVVIDKLPATLAEGCAALARLAPDLYPGQGPPGGKTPQMHRILELRLQDRTSPGREQSTPPLLTYEWRPQSPQNGECLDVGFTPPTY